MRLGPYEIVAALGRGGMGEVYRARDSKLSRDVAIKVLLSVVANDPDRVHRFEREARTLAALNHPNIAHIHGFEEFDGTPALILELVEGPTLADRVAAGPIPLAEALPMARQIADAIEAAHEQGIIHRDLKPANIKLRADGMVKVLDFGLAKALQPSREPGGHEPEHLTQSPTITSPAATKAGIILGTAAYMSPEQARGRTVDRRADIWAFGCVFYEMLTGRCPFAGEDISATLANVITKDPDWHELPDTPPAIRRLLRRCLEKDPRRRLQAIGDARLELDEAGSATSIEEPVGTAHPALPRWRRGLPWMITGAASLAAVLAVRAPWRVTSNSPTIRFDINTPGTSAAEMFAPSPDGRHVVFLANVGGRSQLWLRDIDTIEPRTLEGTDGADYPFWSPDSLSLGFFSQGKLRKMAIHGGLPVALCDAIDGRGGTWNRAGVIVFSASPTSALLRVSASGGVPQPVTKMADGSSVAGHRFPEFLPDGVHLLYVTGRDPSETAGLYLTSLDGGTPVRLLPDVTHAYYASAGSGRRGYLVFRRDYALMAQPFDSQTLTIGADILPVATSIADGRHFGFGAFSLSPNGMLLYQRQGPDAGRSLVWVNRTGKRLGVVGQAGIFGRVRISPDNTTVAVDSGANRNQSDIWLHNLRRDGMARFAFREAWLPVWAPDGKRLAFSTGPTDIYEKSTEGTGQEALVLRGGTNVVPLDWSPDGKWILFAQQDPANGSDLWLVAADGSHAAMPYLHERFNEQSGVFSPDGHWVAYESDESGKTQIYVQAMPAGGAKYQISIDGGTSPEWRRDGKELFFVSQDQTLMAAPIALDARVDAGVPQRLFPGVDSAFAVSRDGQRILLNVPAEGGSRVIPPITVVSNWPASLNP